MDELKRARRLLGVSASSTREQVREAFRSSAKLHHPDAGGSAERFTELRQAYELSRDAAGSPRILRSAGPGTSDGKATIQNYPDLSARIVVAQRARARSFAEILARKMGYA